MLTVRRIVSSVGLMVAMLVALTGCVRADENVKLNADGSGTLKQTVGLSSDFLALASGLGTSQDDILKQVDDSIQKDIDKNGGTYRRYTADGFTNWEITRSFKSVSELNAKLNDQLDLGASDPSTGVSSTPSPGSTTLKVSQDSSFFSNSFHATGKLDFSTSDLDTSAIPGGSAQLLANAQLSVEITMPGWVSSHKGGTQSGNTVSYVVKAGQTADIDVVGGALTTGGIASIAGGSLLALVLIGGGIFLFLRRRNAAQTSTPAVETAMPAPVETTYNDPSQL